jgi:exopolysaccharide biosynthesis protein
MSDFEKNYSTNYKGVRSTRNCIKKRNRRIAIIILMLPFLTPITFILMIRFLPFYNVRNVIVSSLTTTLNHGNLAKLFASQSYIDNLTAENRLGIKEGFSNKDLLNISNKHDKSISLVDVKSNSFHGKMLIINDPTSISVGLSKYLPDHGEVTSSIGRRLNAVAAINAGGFNGKNWGGLGGKPFGVIIKDGKFIYKPPYYKQYIDTVGFTWKGELIVGLQRIDNLLNLGIKEAVCFGPALIVNGQTMIKRGDGGMGIAPRTAIGQTRDGKVLMLVIDGRQLGSQGAYLKDVMTIMKDYGAFNAANLDGGASTTMYVNGRVINNPSDLLGERAVPDVFIVK